MSILTSKPFAVHCLGLCAVVIGAAFSEQFGSMLPLAMGSALALMTTAGLVREIRRRARLRHAASDARDAR